MAYAYTRSQRNDLDERFSTIDYALWLPFGSRLCSAVAGTPGNCTRADG